MQLIHQTIWQQLLRLQLKDFSNCGTMKCQLLNHRLVYGWALYVHSNSMKCIPFICLLWPSAALASRSPSLGAGPQPWAIGLHCRRPTLGLGSVQLYGQPWGANPGPRVGPQGHRVGPTLWPTLGSLITLTGPNLPWHSPVVTGPLSLVAHSIPGLLYCHTLDLGLVFPIHTRHGLVSYLHSHFLLHCYCSAWVDIIYNYYSCHPLGLGLGLGSVHIFLTLTVSHQTALLLFSCPLLLLVSFSDLTTTSIWTDFVTKLLL